MKIVESRASDRSRQRPRRDRRPRSTSTTIPERAPRSAASRIPRRRGQQAQQAAGQSGREKVARLAAALGQDQAGQHAEATVMSATDAIRGSARLLPAPPIGSGIHERDQQPKPEPRRHSKRRRGRAD